MKKLLAIACIILAVSLVFTLVSCSGKTEGNTTTVSSADNSETKNLPYTQITEIGNTEIASETKKAHGSETLTESDSAADGNPDKPVSTNVVSDKPDKTTVGNGGTVTGVTSGAHFPEKTTATTTTNKTTTTRKVTTTRPNQTVIVTATDGAGNLFTVIVSEAN